MGAIVALFVLTIYLTVRVPSHLALRSRAPTLAQERPTYTRGVQVTPRPLSGRYGAQAWAGAGKAQEEEPVDRPLRVGGELWSTPVEIPIDEPRGEAYIPQPTARRSRRPSPPPPDPLIGMLTSLKYTRGEAVAWAAQVQGETSEARITEVLRRHGELLLQIRKQKAGMPSTATLTALVRQGCDKTAQEVAEEQCVDAGAIEEELGLIRAHAEGAEDLGTGTLIMDENTGEVVHRIGSGLPGWLQDRGGSKAILAALDKRSGKLWDDLNMLAIERTRDAVPF